MMEIWVLSWVSASFFANLWRPPEMSPSVQSPWSFGVPPVKQYEPEAGGDDLQVEALGAPPGPTNSGIFPDLLLVPDDLGDVW